MTIAYLFSSQALIYGFYSG